MFNTRSRQIARTFLLPYLWIFSLVYSPLNSATLSCSSEVTLCKGCIKHECIKIKNGKKQKEILNPPKNYVRTMLESGNILVDPNNPINVEDRAHLTHHKKWCTKVPNMYGHFIHIPPFNLHPD